MRTARFHNKYRRKEKKKRKTSLKANNGAWLYPVAAASSNSSSSSSSNHNMDEVLSPMSVAEVELGQIGDIAAPKSGIPQDSSSNLFRQAMTLHAKSITAKRVLRSIIQNELGPNRAILLAEDRKLTALQKYIDAVYKRTSNSCKEVPLKCSYMNQHTPFMGWNMIATQLNEIIKSIKDSAKFAQLKDRDMRLETSVHAHSGSFLNRCRAYTLGGYNMVEILIRVLFIITLLVILIFFLVVFTSWN